MTTTTKLGDFLGRALTNDNPGTSNATDYLGRAVTASNKDSLGRALVDTPNYPPADRANSTAYTLGQRVKVAGINEVQTIAITGTPDSLAYKLQVPLNGDTKTTTELTQASSAAAITAAIVALDNVSPGEVVVTGTYPNFTATIQSERGNVGQITAVDKSFVGGTAPAITTGTTTQGSAGGAVYEVVDDGTSDSSVPTLPAVGATVTDGTVTWKRLK